MSVVTLPLPVRSPVHHGRIIKPQNQIKSNGVKLDVTFFFKQYERSVLTWGAQPGKSCLCRMNLIWPSFRRHPRFLPLPYSPPPPHSIKPDCNATPHKILHHISPIVVTTCQSLVSCCFAHDSMVKSSLAF